MTIIDENTVVVFSSTELKNVLENNNEYNYIYLGDNISLDSGIKISNSKINITIDGTYNGVVYTFEDKKTLNSGDTINVSFPSIFKVTICNMNIVGYNYYGIVYVPESSSYKNVVIEYNNIVYVGPQLSYNPVGLTRIIDSDITIQDGVLTIGNEVAECNQIEIGGVTNITHNSKSNSAFWFRNANPSFKILINANVNFISKYRELFYGVNNLSFSILSNAYFSVTSYSGMAYGNYGTLDTIISSNASFVLKQTNYNGSYATWYSYGSIVLNDNSSLSIINNYDNISTSNYNIYFSNNSAFTLNNPKKVILYNEKANVIYSNSNIPFNFNFSRVNLFTNTIKIDDDISLSTLPTYAWYKENGNSEINGTFSSNATKIDSHNYTDAELKNLPDIANFIFANKKIFSVGDFLFRVDAVTDTDLSISGLTIPKASILISYNNINSVINADDNGIFSYSYENTLPIGTIINFNVKEYNDLLYHSKSIQIVYSGELILESASKTVSFELKPISSNPILCPRIDDLYVKVVDSRVSSSDWKLYASIRHDLTSSTGNILKDSLVYRDESGNISILSTNPVLVYTGKKNDGNTLSTNVSWNRDEGILLMITDKIINNIEYETNIIWSIEEQ